MESGPSTAPAHTMFNVNKDGTSSKKRLHKGNIPTLPQNKLCPHCPAKFTRSTHLNRHLRTHSNQKFHECDRCRAQFTRKDLLTRHQRSCDSSGIRSRRKSCLPCAESKQKCDTGRPCTRCTARSRECVYALVSLDKSESPLDNGPLKRDLELQIGKTTYPGSEMLAHRFPELELHESSLFSSDATSPGSASSVVDSGLGSSLAASPSSTNAMTSPIQSVYEEPPCSEVFATFLGNIFASGTSPGSNQRMLSNEPSPPEHLSQESQDGFPYFVTNIDLQPFLASTIAEPWNDYPMYTNVYPSASISGPPAVDRQEEIAMTRPSEPELQYYLYLFFSVFLGQMPLVHSPTWSMEDKPPILINAMQACGALYVKTPAATQFISATLASARDMLIGEFARKISDPKDQVHLIMAVVLLQTIGLFHQHLEQRASSTIYHGMLIMMIRKSALMIKVSRWAPPNLAHLSPEELEQAWKDWASIETAKRSLCLSFLHDCCHCIFFALPPSLHPAEFNLALPCETTLWKAKNAREWVAALNDEHTPHRTNTWNRLKGIPLQEVFKILRAPPPNPHPPLVLSSLAHFIIIHAITTQVNHLGVLNPHGITTVDTPDGIHVDQSTMTKITDLVTELQVSLHNWLQSWSLCPEAVGQNSDSLPFMCNALPFYWMAQVSLIAYQRGLPPFGPAFTMRGEEKFKLMKEWVRHIRTFLKKGEQSATIFLDELMKIRMRNWQTEMAGNAEQVDEADDGLIGFF